MLEYRLAEKGKELYVVCDVNERGSSKLIFVRFIFGSNPLVAEFGGK